MPKISINAGDGLGFTDDSPKKLTLKTSGDNISSDVDGLYVNDLTGKPGKGGTIVDGWTVINHMEDYDYQMKPYIHAGTVAMIVSVCAYKIIDRQTGDEYVNMDVTVSDTEFKTIKDVVSELNMPIDLSSSNLNNRLLRPGNFIVLTNKPARTSVTNRDISKGKYIAVERCDRFPVEGQKALALLCVNSVHFFDNHIRIKTLRTTCLWSTIPAYAKGQEYSCEIE